MSKLLPMSEQRFVERQRETQQSLHRLQEALAEPVTPIVRDAVIQRFEFTFELVWKTLQLFLEHHGLECGSPRTTLKKAFREGLIPTAEEADVWLQMLEDRNLTSHTYDEALADRIFQQIARDYAPLLAHMTKRIQQLTWE
jgi:nucleotidyltransferase substrate binding protein (TIGR01987 family)